MNDEAYKTKWEGILGKELLGGELADDEVQTIFNIMGNDDNDKESLNQKVLEFKTHQLDRTKTPYAIISLLDLMNNPQYKPGPQNRNNPKLRPPNPNYNSGGRDRFKYSRKSKKSTKRSRSIKRSFITTSRRKYKNRKYMIRK